MGILHWLSTLQPTSGDCGTGVQAKAGDAALAVIGDAISELNNLYLHQVWTGSVF